MSQFQVDPATGDLVRSGSSFVRVDGVDEIAQFARVRIRLWTGENVFDQNLGVPYLEVLLKKGVTFDEVAGAFREALQGTPGVEAVEDVQASQTAAQKAARVAEVRFSCTISVEDARRRIPLQDTVTVPVQEG